jgi:predicted dehydrogenase
VDASRGSVESPFSLEFDLGVWAQLTFSPSDGGGPRRKLATPQPGGLSEVAIWEQFASAVRGDGKPAVTAHSVLPTMALLDAAHESSRTGRTIDVFDVRWSDE